MWQKLLSNHFSTSQQLKLSIVGGPPSRAPRFRLMSASTNRGDTATSYQAIACVPCAAMLFPCQMGAWFGSLPLVTAASHTVPLGWVGGWVGGG